MVNWNLTYDENEGPTWSKPCERCRATVERWRGEGDVLCPRCGAVYNCGGQRLRDDWSPSADFYDEEDETPDLEAEEVRMLRRELYG